MAVSIVNENGKWYVEVDQLYIYPNQKEATKAFRHILKQQEYAVPEQENQKEQQEEN